MFEHRLRVLFTIIAAGFLILVGRLFYLQVFCHAYYVEKAENNIAFTETLPTMRGEIYDRNGIPLASNQIEYEVRIWLGRFEGLEEKDRDRWVRMVAEALGVAPIEVLAAIDRTEEDARVLANQRKTPEQRVDELKYIRSWCDLPFFRNVSKETTMRLELEEYQLPRYRQRSKDYPVLRICEGTERVYPQGAVASNLLGYMNRITPEEYYENPGLGYGKSYDGSELKAYLKDEMIGRTGLERYHNRRLRGSRGRRLGIKDVYQRVQQEIKVLSPVPGSDVRLTIDVRLQQLLEVALDNRLSELKAEGLDHRGGAAVIMDPVTGDILACATSPRYAPNTVLAEYSTQANDPNHPLFDRSRLGLYPLGSVFKVVVGLAGLDNGTLTGSTEFTCTGSFTMGNKTWRCPSVHGPLQLEQAIERSCNYYFYQAGLLVGGPHIHDMAQRLGLGRASDVDLTEAAGFVPLPSSKAELVNLSIGGGRLQVTPLQAARMMCALANQGRLPRPRLDLSRPIEVTDLGIDPVKLSVVRWGMHDVVMGNSGTARNTGRVPGLTYAAKTGTANLDTEGLYHAWYCGFAPFKTPKLAFAVVIGRTRESGGQAGAPLIRNVFVSMQADPELRKYLIEDEPEIEAPAEGAEP